ncbi:hypothetical protein JCM8097_002384 [Rhodosporidiobolus ruineniae]
MCALPSLPEALLVAAFTAPVLLAPGTKVEESFTLHAARDALVHGYKDEGALSQWDHHEFAGAVPRSFIPPIVLANLSKPVLFLASRLGLLRDGLDAQITIRLTLAFFSALSLIFFSRRVAASYGGKVAKYFFLLQATSFHVPFWAGRTLPNMLAFPLVQIAFALLVTPPALTNRTASPRQSTKRTLATAFALLTFAAVVIRLELVALIASFALEHLVRGTLSLVELIEVGLLAGGASLALTVAVDTLLWRAPTWLWPELAAARFNIIEGKAADWGVSPFHYYLFPTLPRLLHLTLPFALFSLAVDRRTRRLLWPCIGFIALLSGLKHKEWRFIVYVLPAFFVAAAAGVVALGAITASPRFRRFILFSLLALNLLFTLLGLTASTSNYPGLSAIQALEAHLTAGDSIPLAATSRGLIRVWVGVEAKMKGASNFALYDSGLSSKRGPEAWYLPEMALLSPVILPVEYDKSESALFTSSSSASDSLLPALVEHGFDYALVDADTLTPGAEVVFQSLEYGGIDWRGLVSGKVRSLEGLVAAKRRPSVRVVKVETGEEV